MLLFLGPLSFVITFALATIPTRTLPGSHFLRNLLMSFVVEFLTTTIYMIVSAFHGDDKEKECARSIMGEILKTTLVLVCLAGIFFAIGRIAPYEDRFVLLGFGALILFVEVCALAYYNLVAYFFSGYVRFGNFDEFMYGD